MSQFLESQLEHDFIQSAVRRSDLLRRGDAEKANDEYDKLHKLKNKMRSLPDRGEAALKRISTSDDPEIKILAAVALLAIDEVYAVDLLNSIVERRLGTKSFEARMTLQEWRNGSLKDYWA